MSEVSMQAELNYTVNDVRDPPPEDVFWQNTSGQDYSAQEPSSHQSGGAS